MLFFLKLPPPFLNPYKRRREFPRDFVIPVMKEREVTESKLGKKGGKKIQDRLSGSLSCYQNRRRS